VTYDESESRGSGLRRALASVLGATGIAAILGVSALAVFFFQPFGERGWISLSLAALLVGVILALNQKRGGPMPTIPRGRLRIHRFLRLAGNILVGVLGGWLALIGWSALSAGGSMPPPAKSNPEIIRVVTWNILHGTEQGAPWSRFGWRARKRALEQVLLATAPEILCVQEALEEQVSGLAKLLSGYGRVGVGRGDGQSAGEYCAIFFDRGRFEELDGGTFWLEEPTAEPPRQTILGPKRICTWVRLRDRRSGGAFRVYNLHTYMTEGARLAAAQIILARIAQGDPADGVVVTGDFNAPPGTPDRLLFGDAGLESSDALGGRVPGAATYQFYGIRLKSLDDVLVSRGWRVLARRVLDMKPGNTFPSDHFGVMVDLVSHPWRS
jgi:endonuclease/exonuclease/phosphatase family metal-dependent hydrolase